MQLLVDPWRAPHAGTHCTWEARQSPRQAHSGSGWHLRARTIKPAGLYSHAPATMPCSRQLEGLGRTLDPRASEQGHWNCNIIQQIVALSSPSRRACALVHDPSPIFALASPSRRVLVCALHDPSSRSRIWKRTPSMTNSREGHGQGARDRSRGLPLQERAPRRRKQARSESGPSASRPKKKPSAATRREALPQQRSSSEWHDGCRNHRRRGRGASRPTRRRARAA